MAVQLASNLAPKNGQSFYLLEDIYLKGGFMVVPDLITRDALPFANLKLGQLVYVWSEKKCWQVVELEGPTLENPTQPMLIVWDEFSFGGEGSGGGGEGIKPRQVLIHNIPDLPPSSSVEFQLNLGISAMILRLSVDRPVKVTVYSTEAKDEPNPYTFLATEDHLVDDGTTLLSDGTILRSRQYSIFANLESPPANRIFVKVDSVDATEGPVNLTITYLTLEDGPVPEGA